MVFIGPTAVVELKAFCLGVRFAGVRLKSGSLHV